MTFAKTPFQASLLGAGVFAALALALVAIPSGTASAQTAAEDLRLTVGKSVVIDYPSDIRQISTSNPEILDASPVTTREILLHGKGLGTATMVVWSKSGQRTFYNVNVELNVDPLRKLLKDSFPNENIRVFSSRDSISLSGKVSSKEIADRAVAASQTFSKVVVNNLGISPGPVEKQILLRVKFAELDRSTSSDFGVNLVTTGALNTIGRTTTGANAPPAVTPDRTLSISDALNIFAFRPDLNLGAFIKALQSKGVLQILAEPNLVTSNGKEANFLVGGEFPIPIVQGGGNASAISIQFREFGIRLKFTPTITENKTIKLQLKQEVSTIDIANGVSVSGFRIPALSTRRAETDIELQEGQSFIIAGLVDNRETESYSKIPGLGSIPIFGALFKSRSDTKSRSELVVMVTPEITTPLGPNDPKPIPYMPNEFLVPIASPGSKTPATTAAKAPKSSSKKRN